MTKSQDKIIKHAYVKFDIKIKILTNYTIT